MGTDVEARVRSQERHGVVERAADGEQRGGRDDAVDVTSDRRAVHPFGQAEVVRGDDQAGRAHGCGHRSTTGWTVFSWRRRPRISLSMVPMTAGEDRVETPRVRGK
jgi:hypothetical protein